MGPFKIRKVFLTKNITKPEFVFPILKNVQKRRTVPKLSKGVTLEAQKMFSKLKKKPKQ